MTLTQFLRISEIEIKTSKSVYTSTMKIRQYKMR